MAIIRRPAGQKQKLKAGYDFAVFCEVLKVERIASLEDSALRRCSQALGQRVGFAKFAQIVHERVGVCIAGTDRQAIGDRQRETRALQQTAQITDISHRQDTGRQTAGDFSLCLRETGA